MHKLHLSHGIENECAETHHLHTHGFKVELGAGRELHPAIGHQDPECGEVGADSHQPGCPEVLNLAQTIPAKEEHTDEGRLQEKRHQPFNGQRRPENVTHIVRIVGPVGTKLELHGQTRSDPKGKVDGKQLAPELGHVLVNGIVGHHIDRLHDRQDKRHPQRQWNKYKVIEHCCGKLDPRQLNHSLIDHDISSPICIPAALP